MISKKQQQGFTLLYAVLIAGLLLAIGLAIVNIAIKEVTLSATSRDAQFAFYAADAGMECALFWDLQQSAFSISSPQASVSCGGSANTVTATNPTPGKYERRFSLDFSPEQYCAEILVVKNDNPMGSPARRTTIESRGYNTCDVDNPRRVERALRTKY